MQDMSYRGTFKLTNLRWRLFRWFHLICVFFFRSPKTTLQQLYKALRLPGFESFWTKAQVYLESVKGYQKNRYRMNERGRQKVRERWQRTFDHYGYSM